MHDRACRLQRDWASRPPPPQIVLLGDSHAAHWFPALTEAAKIHGWTATSVLKSGCMSMKATAVGVKAAGSTWPACQSWFGRAVQWVLAEKVFSQEFYISSYTPLRATYPVHSTVF